MQIALTGPSGAGKSSIARAVAYKIKHQYLDLGLLFRFMTYVLDEGICLNFRGVNNLVKSKSFCYQWDREWVKIVLGGEDITYRLQSLPISQKTAELSSNPESLKKLIKISSRFIIINKDIVCDGRSAGTLILSRADHKFYITASERIRAERRMKELKEKDASITYEDVLKNISLRDKLDREREFNPLIIPDGANIIDTGILGFKDSVKIICSIINQ